MALEMTTPQLLPADFIEQLSLELLLQPDAEYFFARAAFSAMVQQQMSSIDPIGWDIAKAQMMVGGPYKPQAMGQAANMLEAMARGEGGPLLLSQGVMYPDLIKMVKEAKNPGQVIKIDRPVYVDGDLTPGNRQLSPQNNFFGTRSQALGMEQASLTIKEYGGPTDPDGNISALSVPSFTANRSKHDLFLYLGTNLKRDRWRFFNYKIMTEMIGAAVAAGYVTRPVGMTSRATYTQAGNEPFSYDLIVSAGEQMKSRKIPGVNNEPFYPTVISTRQAAQLKLDARYERIGVFHEKYNVLFPGYLKTVDSAILIELQNLPTVTGQGENSDVTLYQALMMAPFAYGWGSAMDARVIRNTNDDGGRKNEYGWIAYEESQTLDDRFYQAIETD